MDNPTYGLLAEASNPRFCLLLIMVTLSLAAIPAVAQRAPTEYSFLEVRGNGLTFGGVTYEPQSIIDCGGIEGTTVSLVDASGNIVRMQGGLYGVSPHVIVTVPWDDKNHTISCTVPSGSEGMRSLALGILAIPFVILPILAAIGTSSPHRLWWLPVSVYLIAQFAMALHTSARLGAIRENCESARQVVRSHTVYHPDRSVLTPIRFAETIPIRYVPPNEQDLSDLLLAPYKIVGAAFILLFQVPAAIAGFHYLTTRHPAEQLFDERGSRPRPENVGAAMGHKVDLKNPMPEYQSRNWQRRIEALRKRIDAESDFIESDIARRRAYAKRNSTNDRGDS
jgi:hypothetical protein